MKKTLCPVRHVSGPIWAGSWCYRSASDNLMLDGQGFSLMPHAGAGRKGPSARWAPPDPRCLRFKHLFVPGPDGTSPVPTRLGVQHGRSAPQGVFCRENVMADEVEQRSEEAEQLRVDAARWRYIKRQLVKRSQRSMVGRDDWLGLDINTIPCEQHESIEGIVDRRIRTIEAKVGEQPASGKKEEED